MRWIVWLPTKLQLWKFCHSTVFGCAALGGVAYYTLSLINDFTDNLPLPWRIAGGLLTAFAARAGLAYDLWRITHEKQWG